MSSQTVWNGTRSEVVLEEKCLNPGKSDALDLEQLNLSTINAAEIYISYF